MQTTWTFRGRKGLTIDHNWGLLPDPMGRCKAQSWWKKQRQPGRFFPSYDDDAFWPTTVPGSFVRVHPELEYYEGEAVYLVQFDLADDPLGERTFINFENICDRAVVYLNGRLVGEFDGPHQAHCEEISAYIQKQNRMFVLVDNKRNAEHVPGTMHDWFHEGGILGPATIYQLPKTAVRDTRLVTRLRNDQRVEITMDALLDGTRRDERVATRFSLRNPRTGDVLAAESAELRPGAWGGVTICLNRQDVELWSGENPFLHDLIIETAEDQWSEPVGLREVSQSGRNILLNGEPVILKGIAGYLDSECGNFPQTPAAVDRMLDTIKDLNCNFVRAGHVPPSKALLDACDRRGLLVWAEVPAYWQPKVHYGAQRLRALAMLESMIRSGRNSASVILWSIGNECFYHDPENSQSNISYFMEAADRCRELDPSRLVTYTGGFEGSGNPHLEKICPKSLVDRLDVIGINSYAGQEDGADPEAEPEFDKHWDKLRAAAEYGKPVIIAEIGIDAVLGEEGFDYGEARQAEYYRKTMDLFHKAVAEGVLQGLIPFTLSDYKTPIKLGRFQAGYNRKGIQTQDGKAKMAYQIVKEGYGRRNHENN
jgi:beta-glucuronidase